MDLTAEMVTLLFDDLIEFVKVFFDAIDFLCESIVGFVVSTAGWLDCLQS